MSNQIITVTEHPTIERYGYTWAADDPINPRHDFCDACDRGETPESCCAWIEVSVPYGQGSRRLQRFRSAGLYGICGADDAYCRHVEAEEWTDLVAHCARFGVTVPEVAP